MSSSTWAGRMPTVEAYRNSPTPNLIIIETAGDRSQLIGHLDRLAEFCDTGHQGAGDRTRQRHPALSRADRSRA